MKTPIIYFDSDGVFANWVEYVLTNHLPWMDEIDELNKHPSRDSIIKSISKNDPDMFSKLPVIEGSGALIDWVRKVGLDFRILTAVGNSEDFDRSKKSKEYWWKKQFNVPADKVIVTIHSEDKYRIPHKGNILVDDFHVNITQWENTGGFGVLVEEENINVEEVVNEIRNYIKLSTGENYDGIS